MKPILKKKHAAVQRSSHKDRDVDRLSNSMLDALSRGAYAVPSQVEQSQPKEEPKRWKSRFFFRLETDHDIIEEDVARQQQLAAASRRIVEEVTEHTESRATSYSPELQQSLQQNVDRVREFFLKEINPFVLASSLGSAQARDVIQKMLNAEVDSEPYVHFDRVIRRAALTKLTLFVSKYLKVPVAELMKAMEPTATKEVLFFNDELPAKRVREPVSEPVQRNRVGPPSTREQPSNHRQPRPIRRL